MLGWFADLLPAGTVAPDFTLCDQDGDMVTLSKLRGQNIVLVFYPGDSTRICTGQLCDFRDQEATGASAGTLVFGVNPQSQRSHLKFHERYQLSFPLLVDRGGKVARLYHAGGLFVRRTVYVVGRDGIILFAKRGRPDPIEVLAAAH